uniref:Phorbol-ester/DAG-type domain-containing protein n=1 Tax=Ciona savignyi TaxID=51511 RepID=H2YN40_CIOSA
MLGLTEDYFSHPGNRLGLSSHEELQIAIESCREIIMRLPETSKRREKLVERLVELRLKLQDPTENEPNLKTVLGHQFIKQMSKTMKRNCDCCSKTIWGLFQMWYYCQACGFKCHEKCVGATRRSCVALAVKSTYQLKICPEVGLSNQMYSCAECKNPISITGGTADEARLCDYNGLYYCPNCHWNDLVSTPARVLHNWDHTPYKVSRGSYQLLKSSEKRALLEVREINPMLFNFVEELAQIRKLREDILKMKPYFLTCSIALELKLLCKLEDRQHFVDGSHMYSMRDLTQAMDGSLTQDLSRTHTEFAKHIKLDCLFCQAKGFVCEICNAGETLFPFDSMVSICPRCSAVFHSDCFSCIDTMCPRCKRKQQKKQTSWEESSSSDDD